MKDEILEQVSETASNIFFEFMEEIEDTKLYDEYIIPTKDGTDSTEKASELYYRIEDHLEKLLEIKTK
tara:strand:+ start:550 stop:753 length:204 start_codon:yes stop_codon:yes gene_type:complete